ncbi:cytochrome P450 [Streptomyces daliensis]|uniref:Cytochrome P450 n=1 Tax=Streptomyces daliensis TaxID=299421 RepID=A0A8T4IYZ1_9ACTN|nr:cytochrome P450 [Streptomyces daliensis]
MTRAADPLPTAPGALPLTGHVLQLRRNPLASVQAQRDRGDVVAFRLGRQRAYLVNDPELVHQILVTQAHGLTKGVLFQQGRRTPPSCVRPPPP